MMPSSVAIARAVAGWSPVISTGVMPAARQASDRRRGGGARRVEDGDQAEQVQPAFHHPGGRLVSVVGRRDGQDPEAFPRQLLGTGGCPFPDGGTTR